MISFQKLGETLGSILSQLFIISSNLYTKLRKIYSIISEFKASDIMTAE